MDEKINENMLRIIGMASIESEILFGSDIEVTVVGNLVRTEISDNHDGTFDRIFKVRIITAKVNKK